MASCAADEDPFEAALYDDDGDRDEDVGSISESLAKGTPGAVNGAKDYCDDAGNQCALGEGDCDSHAQCAPGLRCLPNNGIKFGFPADYDVCAPAHCNNKVQDVAMGETGVDVGGPCGSAPAACSGAPGDKNFCVGCLCASGQGDCDSDAECAPGLICGIDNGPSFGLPSGHDVCVPPHCKNGVRDADSGETGVDKGGPCGADLPSATRNVFFSEYVEGSNNNHHLEIYNAGSQAQSCTVQVYFEGATVAGSTIALNASVAPGGLFVLCRTGGSVASPPCHQFSTILTFTGDDAIVLECGGEVQDIIGQIGVDPGTQWGSGLASTMDNTLRRKCSVKAGDRIGSDVFLPSTEWDGFANNDFTNLGAGSCP